MITSHIGCEDRMCMKRALTIVCLIFLLQPVMARRVRLVTAKPLQEQLSQGPVTYVVRKAFDLSGATITVPKGATLLFRGGSLSNGELAGSFYVKGVKKGSLCVMMKKGSQLLSEIPVYNSTPNINASVISAGRSGIVLREDIHIESDINLHCTLDGDGHKLSAESSVACVLRILDSSKDISISNIVIKRSYSGEINKNYAIICKNSSNVTIADSYIEGRLYFVNNTMSDEDSEISSGFTIRNCDLYCDLQSCPQGWQYGQDHLAFYSVKDITISNSRIYSYGVNRVIKTSQYFPKDDYSDVSRCTDNVLFENNMVVANSAFGKQMWDMFCGSTNIVIRNNSFAIEGFTRFVEDKSYQEKYSHGSLVLSCIQILNNTVYTSGADLFQFRASPDCDQFEICNSIFIMGGRNSNQNTGFERSCGGYLQGYKRMLISGNSFKWEDDAKGLLFLKINFTCDDTRIENNNMEDVYRINMSSASHPKYGRQPVSGSFFSYTGNTKSYSEDYGKSREELHLADVAIKNVTLNVLDNPFGKSYEAIIGERVMIDSLNYSSLSNESSALLYSK